jgi:hypothetical protein
MASWWSVVLVATVVVDQAHGAINFNFTSVFGTSVPFVSGAQV